MRLDKQGRPVGSKEIILGQELVMNGDELVTTNPKLSFSDYCIFVLRFISLDNLRFQKANIPSRIMAIAIT